ncbi:M23 family metallopeptidase, partial [candidate division WWE3 bacterium]|nr:M23 family metallopeptidase [candidate division WWE3 bacterium]
MTARRIGLLLVVAIMVGLLNSSVFATGLGFSWPVSNSNRSITQPYHLANELGYSFEHRGIDLIGDRGIYATESGTIVLSGWDTYGCGTADEAGWNNLSEAQRTSRSCGGYMVKVKHSVPSGTNYHSLYAHLVRGCYLTGGSVTKGQQLGVMGESGYVTGRHLHYELRTAESHDSAINPSSDLTTEPAMTSIFPCLYLTGNVVVSPNPAAEKDALTITIPVTNMGPAATVEKIDVTMRTGTGATWKYGTSSPIAFAQAESKVITISGPAWEGHAGSWQITSIDYRYLTDKWRGVDANGKTLTTSFVVNASPPRLELTGDVTMSAYTVTGGQSVSFSVPVKNWGGNLTMTDSYLDVTTSNGSIWKATGVNQNIAANGTTTLTFSGQLWQTPGGTWTVHEVSYKDS